MDIESYRIFLDVADNGSISETARILHYSQPGISHIISEMEKECGFALFFRSKKGMSLTDKGRILYAMALKVLEADKALASAVNDMKGDVAGTLRIGAYFSIQETILPDILEEMYTRYPKVSYVVRGYEPNDEGDILKSGSIDVGIGMSDAPAGFSFVPLFQDESVVVLPPGHPLAKKTSVKAKELESCRLLMQEDRCANELKMAFGPDFSSLQSSLIFNSDPFLLRLAEKGLGVGVTSRILIQPHYKVEVRPLDPPVFRTLGLITPVWKPLSSAARAFMAIAKKKYGKQGV